MLFIYSNTLKWPHPNTQYHIKDTFALILLCVRPHITSGQSQQFMQHFPQLGQYVLYQNDTFTRWQKVLSISARDHAQTACSTHADTTHTHTHDTCSEDEVVAMFCPPDHLLSLTPQQTGSPHTHPINHKIHPNELPNKVMLAVLQIKIPYHLSGFLGIHAKQPDMRQDRTVLMKWGLLHVPSGLSHTVLRLLTGKYTLSLNWRLDISQEQFPGTAPEFHFLSHNTHDVMDMCGWMGISDSFR